MQDDSSRTLFIAHIPAALSLRTRCFSACRCSGLRRVMHTHRLRTRPPGVGVSQKPVYLLFQKRLHPAMRAAHKHDRKTVCKTPCHACACDVLTASPVSSVSKTYPPLSPYQSAFSVSKILTCLNFPSDLFYVGVHNEYRIGPVIVLDFAGRRVMLRERQDLQGTHNSDRKEEQSRTMLHQGGMSWEPQWK
jgi:hypothetical protein